MATAEAKTRWAARWADILGHPECRRGAREIMGVAPGMVAWALMTGVAISNARMSALEGTLFGVFVYAGSAQLAALPLISDGASAWVVLLTALCVNLRFIVFSAHLQPYVAHHGPVLRVVMGYLMADLSYVLFTRRFPQAGTTARERQDQDMYWLSSGVLGWFLWVGATLVGMLLGHSIPASWNLGFAGTLALVAVTCTLLNTRLRVASACIAGVVALVAYALPFKLNILAAIVCAGLACAVIEYLGARNPHAKDGRGGI